MGSLTLTQVASQVQDALGSTPSGNLNTEAIAKQALEWLYNVHPWNWRARGPVDINMYANTFAVNLPQDFGEIEELTFPGFFYATITAVSMGDILDLRANTPTVTTSGLWFAWAINPGAESVPQRTQSNTGADGSLKQHTGGTIATATPTQLVITMDTEYTWVRGDIIQIDGGTNVTQREYVVLAYDRSSNTLTLNESPLTDASIAGSAITIRLHMANGTFTANTNDVTDPAYERQFVELYPKISQTRRGVYEAGNNDSGLQARYRKSPVTRSMAASDVAKMPDWMDWAWVQAARAFGKVIQDGNDLAAEMAHLQSTLLPPLYEKDGAVQENMGMMRGGLHPRNTNFLLHEPVTVSDP